MTSEELADLQRIAEMRGRLREIDAQIAASDKATWRDARLAASLVTILASIVLIPPTDWISMLFVLLGIAIFVRECVDAADAGAHAERKRSERAAIRAEIDELLKRYP